MEEHSSHRTLEAYVDDHLLCPRTTMDMIHPEMVCITFLLHSRHCLPVFVLRNRGIATVTKTAFLCLKKIFISLPNFSSLSRYLSLLSYYIACFLLPISYLAGLLCTRSTTLV